MLKVGKKVILRSSNANRQIEDGEKFFLTVLIPLRLQLSCCQIESFIKWPR